MFVPVEKADSKEENYRLLLEYLPYYINKDDPWYTTLANAAAVMRYFIDDINWIGFYVKENDMLHLGPFQGLAACTQIRMGHGVCGQAAEQAATLKVDDVISFEGHITCDANSESEIVLPIMKEETLFGVLDIDAPIKKRFEAVDQVFLEKVVALLVDFL